MQEHLQEEHQEQNITQQRSIWGLLLVGAGLLFLLQNLGLIHDLSGLVWAALFGLGGAIFLYFFLNDRHHAWWAALPGCALLGLAGVIFLGDYAPAPLDQLSGGLFLGSIGAGFGLVYLTDPRKWWALIPGGVMVTLGIVAAADEIGPGLDSGGLFFIGLGLTFLLVALAPGGEARRWALIPAAVLLVMGTMLGLSALAMFGSLWPVALIAGGLYLLWRNRQAKEV